ncbi:MHC class ii antigen presentation inhibitor [Pteropox virus]|uniref:MHC class ii antigen presentation inhibitor n=1 Tax=Pteropox virus TaxID=1873698 RepID=A0A1B1MRJ8_9POXV|nr:MHC class ii antigen presentation inhibitor [Pteropox virus]ANS71214.1 MHC class ii antigen presentation inhibitor [Pteropox virus]
MPGFNNVLTPLGLICCDRYDSFQQMLHDLGISSITSSIGDYWIAPIHATPTHISAIPSLDISRCYVSIHGKLLHAYDVLRRGYSIDKLYLIYETTTRAHILCCNNYDQIYINDRSFGLKLESFKDYVDSREIDVLELYDNGNYDIILSPSLSLLSSLKSKCNICLASGSWIIASTNS